MNLCSYLLCGISFGEQVSSVNVNVLCLVYMEKLVFSNSDRNEELITDKYLYP